MSRTIALVCVASLLLVVAVARAATQQPPRAKVVTTSSGIFTAAQAARGEQTYMSICVSCHPPGTYTAAAFRAKWNGQLLSDLYGFMSNMMPKEQPGSLEPEEYVQVLAYLLKINGAPAGKTPLAADVKPMKKIRIEMPAK